MKHPRFGICQICAKYSFSSFHSCLRAGRQQILRRGSFWTFIFASWLPSHIALGYHFFKECSVPAQKRALLQETTCLRVGLLSIPLSRCRLCLFPYLSLSLSLLSLCVPSNPIHICSWLKCGFLLEKKQLYRVHWTWNPAWTGFHAFMNRFWRKILENPPRNGFSCFNQAACLFVCVLV